MEDERVSIYRASRTIKRRENSLYNALRSIYEDSIFVGEIAQLWPELPLLANLRCGLWYSSRFESNCYFKSTDGHANNWSFNTSRLNLHVALLAGKLLPGVMLSLFSGIGDAEVALYKLGIPLKTIVSVESDVNRNIVRGWREETNQKAALVEQLQHSLIPKFFPTTTPSVLARLRKLCCEIIGEIEQLKFRRGGCIIVDSTRKGKRFPDSMSKTIPIWTCVLNRAIRNHQIRMQGMQGGGIQEHGVSDNSIFFPSTLLSMPESFTHCQHMEDTGQVIPDWDCSLHLPLWVSDTEKTNIEDRLEVWTKELESCGADITSLALSLKKPLRPLWISQKTVIWLNEVPECSSWDFTPIILVSASSSYGNFQHRTTSEFSWNYIPGAGDDEESWAKGLSPSLFWKHVYDLTNSGPESCNQKVADIVEKDRVYRQQRGQNAPQISMKPSKFSGLFNAEEPQMECDIPCSTGKASFGDNCKTFWLGSTNLAVSATCLAANVPNVDCILNCGTESLSICLENPEAYLHVPMINSKLDRFSLLRNIPYALNFAKMNLRRGNKLLLCCNTGEDISICVSLAIITSLFTDQGLFDDGKYFSQTCITKLEMRKRLVFICKYAINARPSRGNLKQVFNFINGGSVDSFS